MTIKMSFPLSIRSKQPSTSECNKSSSSCQESSSEIQKIRNHIGMPKAAFSKLLHTVSRKHMPNPLDTSQKTAATEQTDQTEGIFQTEFEKSVRFSSSDTVRATIARDDYSPEELKASWFQDEEYKAITMECCKQIKKMEAGEVLKDKKYCSRGLETHTKLASISKTENRRLAYDCVLDEQEEQRISDYIDDGAIAAIYAETAHSCLLWAHTVALRDQKAAEDYLDTML